MSKVGPNSGISIPFGSPLVNHYKDVLICCIICKSTWLERLSVILFYYQILVARIKCYVMLCYVILILSQDPVVRGTESAVPKWLRPNRQDLIVLLRSLTVMFIDTDARSLAVHKCWHQRRNIGQQCNKRGSIEYWRGSIDSFCGLELHKVWLVVDMHTDLSVINSGIFILPHNF